jgi:hypothetical protein
VSSAVPVVVPETDQAEIDAEANQKREWRLAKERAQRRELLGKKTSAKSAEKDSWRLGFSLFWADDDSRRRVVIAGSCVALGAIILVVFLGNRSAAGPQALPIAGRLTATELWGEYAKNPVEANKKYGGNIIEITGRISRVLTDKRTPRVELETPTKAKWTIECWFRHPDDLKELQIGKEVTIRGDCEVRAKPNINVHLTSCVVVLGK